MCWHVRGERERERERENERESINEYIAQQSRSGATFQNILVHMSRQRLAGLVGRYLEFSSDVIAVPEFSSETREGTPLLS